MRILGGSILLLLLATHASGLILSGRGNDPIEDHNWPAGALELANLTTRIGWWEGPPFGGGEHHFCYRGDTAAFQKALDRFAAIRAPQLDLIFTDGPMLDQFMTSEKDPKDDGRIDWMFVVWDPQSWYHLYNDPKGTWNADDPHFHQPLRAPTLEVYLGGEGGQIDGSKIKVPAGVTVTDERADQNGAAHGSLIRGDVYDILTSKPIEGVQVEVATQEKRIARGKTDAGGHFEVKDFPPGSRRIIASAKGYAPRLIGYYVFRGNTLKRFPAVRLAPAALIAGSATDTDGKPLQGVTVRADGCMGVDGLGYPMSQSPQTTTDDKGRFELTGLPRGFVHLHARKEAFQQVDVLALHAVPAEDVKLQLTGTGTVKGKVLDAAGKPVSKGNISLFPAGGERVGEWSGSMQIRPDGTFAFDGVPPGRYELSTDPRAAIPGAKVKTKEIEVTVGKTIEVDIPATH
jgi:hypothetical protein